MECIIYISDTELRKLKEFQDNTCIMIKDGIVSIYEYNNGRLENIKSLFNIGETIEIIDALEKIFGIDLSSITLDNENMEFVKGARNLDNIFKNKKPLLEKV